MRKILLVLLFLPALSFAQAPAPTSTTLTQALTGPSPQTGSSTIMGNTVFLASRTGVIGPIVPGTTAVLLYVDREAMAVQSVNPNTGGITVERGYLGTQPTAHNSGATVLYGRTDLAAQTVFYTFDPAGACVAGNAPNPWINVLNANQWTCTGGVWTVTSAIYSTGSGLPAGCTSPASAKLTCSIFIATSSFLNASAAAQSLPLYVSGACDGVGACTGNAIIFQAPASLTGGSATYSWDSSANLTVPGSLFSPVGAAGTPTYSFSGHTNSGLYWNGNGYTTLTQNGADSLGVSLTQIEAINGAVYLWAPTIGGSADSGISRDSAGIIDFGNGNPANSAAFIRSGNTVVLTSNFTTASTSLVTITGFSWTFPATNHNYGFRCTLSYSQATAAAANAFGVQAATTAPTNIYAAMHVDTSLVNAGVNATLPLLSTTTATNIGTFTPSAAGAIGTVADIFTAEIWGTLEQGAGATTLNIMALTGSAADSLTIYRGSSCSLLP